MPLVLYAKQVSGTYITHVNDWPLLFASLFDLSTVNPHTGVSITLDTPDIFTCVDPGIQFPYLMLLSAQKLLQILHCGHSRA